MTPDLFTAEHAHRYEFAGYRYAAIARETAQWPNKRPTIRFVELLACWCGQTQEREPGAADVPPQE